MSEIEHHFHNPTQGQVTKALYQFLADQEIPKKLDDLFQKKVEQVLLEQIEKLLRSGGFEKLLIAAVVDMISRERQPYERNGYGYHNRLRNMVEEEIKRVVLSDYEILVRPRKSKPPEALGSKAVPGAILEPPNDS